MNAEKAKAELRKYASKEKAEILQSFFKTGPGEYGEGDIFIGVTVPNTRKVAKAFLNLSRVEIRKLLASQIHEERLLALLILVAQYEASNRACKEKLYKFYIRNTKYINNWDLVDLTAPKIVGNYLFEKDRSILYEYARSRDLWKRRIAIVCTYFFIRKNDFRDTLALARLLMSDSHDLIHKAVGWMLREVGKGDSTVLEKFLARNYQKMPRTMLRYAIEKFPEKKRQAYLKDKI